ncbi:MAG: hypothetical protein C4527_29030 [Candidatus Omnitrophota bacterium]|nr:MAG: hypothetical protein C4527_29030 [Candidatus Omnitrophota bacterium]
MEKKCMHCEFWNVLDVADSSRREGECRKYAPRVRMDGITQGSWPLTDADDWCGDFQLHSRFNRCNPQDIH